MDLVNDEDVSGGDGHRFTAETGRILSCRGFFFSALLQLFLSSASMQSCIVKARPTY